MGSTKDEIVIAGMSGRYPECDSVEEFKEALLNNVDLITVDDRRFPPGLYGIPPRAGKLKNIEHFDAGFFGISPKQADFMDVRHRIFLETVYEAIMDAGYNPQELRGTKTGVYAGCTGSDVADIVRKNPDTDGYANIGLSTAVCANRVSYVFDFKGPSFSVDTACSSGMFALASAVAAMESGDIDNAIVGGLAINLAPDDYLEFFKLNMLSPDGKCKVFNSDRDGYVRSEAIVAFFLTRKSRARRVYADLLGSKTNADGYKIEGITYPSTAMQLKLMRDMYAKFDFDINDVAYVEAHGTGTPIGDIQECQSLVDMFCQNRKTPLPIGAVKSNMGHSETSSGLCSITKVLIAMETGIIPANLHLTDIAKDIPGINDGRLQVVSKNTPWNGGIVALNCFGFGGANSHVTLRSNTKTKPKSYPHKSHRLVQVSGRTEEAVNHLLNEIEKNQSDEEFLALIDQIHKINVDGHNYRGYQVLGDNPKREVDRCPKEKRPVWFVYTGMGSQWPKLGRDLMKIDVFRNTIKRCATSVKKYNIDLEDLLTNGDEKAFEDITNCFTAIAATEIALTDVLRSMGIQPDGFTGHSLGEVGCAYVNGGLTPEQAVLLGYARGYASVNTKLPSGQMAAVGLSKEECQKLLPDDIFIGCFNSKTSVTISGPKQRVIDLVKSFTDQGIFARLVNTAGYAYHTKYVSDAGGLLLDFIKKVITNPIPRSEKWVSSSVPEDKWGTEAAKYNSAEYHFNNFRCPVLFDQVYKYIPENAIVIEVAPHGLLQAILKRELGSGVTSLSLVNRSSEDNVQFFYSNIGKLYINGGQPNLANYYNNVKFPVSRGTPMIGQMVKWDHSVKWYVPYFKVQDCFGKVVSVNVSQDKFAYLEGHTIDGRVLMPATGYIEMVWDVFSELFIKNTSNMPIVIENIKFKRATVLPPNEQVDFLINITKSSGYFEIFEGGSIVVTGVISACKDISKQFVNPQCSRVDNKQGYLKLKTADVYKEFHLRRYKYTGLFQGILECDVMGTSGKLKWTEKWTSFLDAMMQLPILKESHRDLLLPTCIQKIIIDPIQHLKIFENGINEVPIFVNNNLNIIKCGGCEVIGLEASRAPRRQQTQIDPILETYQFIPYENIVEEVKLEQSLPVCLQLVLENNAGIRDLNICEVISEKIQEPELTPLITKVMLSEPMSDCKFSVIKPDNEATGTYDLMVVTDKVLDEINTDLVSNNLKEQGFVLFKGNCNHNNPNKLNLDIIYSETTKNGDTIQLLRKRIDIPKENVVIEIKTSDLSWLENLKDCVKSKKYKIIYLLSQNEKITGITGLVKCLISEPGGHIFRSILIESDKMEQFSLSSVMYKKQLEKNLTFNVLRDGKWGSFKHLPLKQIENKIVKDACNNILTPGDLSSFRWIERPDKYFSLSPTSELCSVYYASLNFKDVMLASASLQPPTRMDPTAKDYYLGLEYSGVNSKGKRIMGIVEAMSIALQVMNDPLFTWEVPTSWTLEEAATVPVVYATSYYALIMRGQIQPGESILIHAGSGGIGISAISIALSLGCTVYTTVSTPEKKDFIKKMFPQLKDCNIGNSRDTSFEQMILENTNGKGVDLVLNSLAADLFQASIRCITNRGRFLEIGKADFMNSTLIDSKVFLKNCSFHGVFLDDLFMDQSSTKAKLSKIISDGIKNGVVRPLPRTVFNENEVENAFRFLATGKHKGKVLIKIRDEKVKKPERTISALPRVYFDPQKSYVLVGGMGGFGLELTSWMIERGATKIVLNSRRNVSNGYQSFCFKKWKEVGVDVMVNTDDTSSLKGAESLLNFAKGLGPVGGIFNMALVLSDALLENQTVEKYNTVFKGKIISGQNMDTVSRKLCPQLDHFVVFSSIACGRGNSGQSNYGMSNSALEAICEKRKSENLPGLAVQWGPVGDVGYLTNLGIENDVMYGLLPQTITSCLNALEKFMLQPYPVGASTVVADKTVTSTSTSGKTPLEAVAHILGIRNIDQIDMRSTMSELGLDSLMTAEIKQSLYRNYNIELDTDEIRNLTFFALQNMGKDKEEKVEPKSEPTNPEVKLNGHTPNNKEPIDVLPIEDIIRLKKSNSKQPNIVFLLPPIEGHMKMMRPLAKQLNNCTVYGLQLTKNQNFNSITKYKNHFVKEIRQIQKKGPYYLCGYSFGTSLAFELAVELENEGEKVEVILIDGSPMYVKEIVAAKLLRCQENKQEPEVVNLKFFSEVLFNNDATEVSDILETKVPWEKRIQQVSEVLSKKTVHSAEDIAESAITFYKRCYAGYYYNPTGIFKGPITLVRSGLQVIPSFPEDYGLREICEQNVVIHKFPTDHKGMLEGEYVGKLVDIINQTFNLK